MAQTLAILGASSQIARDLIRSMVAAGRTGLLLFVRDVSAGQAWVHAQGLSQHCRVFGYHDYDEQPHDAVLNFVGVGDPRRAVEMGASIFEVTQRFDDLALEGLRRHPNRRYIFISSGAVYGHAFEQAVTDTSLASFPVNAITAQDWYAVAKLHAEVRHRALAEHPIIDLRVFNMFSRTQNIEARFFITDIVRAIRDNTVLQTTADDMVRDFLHPEDFHQLVECLLAAPPANTALDCYSLKPIEKHALLRAMNERFGLQYEVLKSATQTINATGTKPCYYSLSRKAAEFGYVPIWSSLEGVMAETAALLNGSSTSHPKETTR